MTKSDFFGGIEAGGTKFVCALANNPPTLSGEITFSTTTPKESLERVCDYFYPFVKEGRLRSLGIASFGPVDADPKSATYGYITATPKPNWENTDILGVVQRQLGVPTAFHHDVSAAAMGEYTWGDSRGMDPSLYVTIGTGIGGGYLINGIPLVGLTALEMGHVSVPHNLELDPFPGSCPYHGDCFEGLACGPAIEQRLGQRGETLAESNDFWNLESDYIAHALVNYILTLSPRRIILGGGVMQRVFLYEKIRRKVREILNGYLNSEILVDRIEEYIVPPSLGKYSGVLGAISMAMQIKNG